MTSLAVTLAVTLVSYRALARPTPPASPPCPVSLALSTPSPSPRGNLLADVSYDGTVTMLSLANPSAPARAATHRTDAYAPVNQAAKRRLHMQITVREGRIDQHAAVSFRLS